MTREKVDKVESVLTGLVGIAVLAFAGFTQSDGETVTSYIAQLGTWAFGGYTLIKSIIEYVKSKTSK
tara:strand:- start:2119 stop:2319 length:201 start_codon:yes stop_codon:yes gene_type:complete